MVEITQSSTKVIDASARYIPENIQADGLMRLDTIVWDEQQREKVLAWVSNLWAVLKVKIVEETGVEIPDFKKEMVQWVQFEGTQRPEGDHDSTTGVIRINTLTADEKNVASTVAHELFHFIARRLLLKRKETLTPVRTGLRVIGHTLIGKPQNWNREKKGWSSNTDSEESLEFKKWSFSLLDEAVVETISQRVLQSVADQIPHLENEQFEPKAYSEARRFYTTLVKNLVLAWNDPSLRVSNPHTFKFEGTPAWQATQSDEWKNRINKLKTELGIGDTVTEEDIQKVFEKATYEKVGLHKVSRLVNTLLGDGAFKEIYRLSSGLNPSKLEGVEYIKLWEIITKPAETAVKRLEDTQLLIGSQSIEIKKNEVPRGASLISLERHDGTNLGIKQIFQEYESQIETPINKDELLMYAVISQQEIESQKARYPYAHKAVHKANTGQGAFSRVPDRTMAFCFDKLCKALSINLDNAQSKESKTVLGTTFEVEYFPVPEKSNLALANVSITKNENTNSYYYFVST